MFQNSRWQKFSFVWSSTLNPSVLKGTTAHKLFHIWGFALGNLNSIVVYYVILDYATQDPNMK